jgi:hypothetical protein
MGSNRSHTTVRDLIDDPDVLSKWLEPQLTVTFHDDPNEDTG